MLPKKIILHLFLIVLSSNIFSQSLTDENDLQNLLNDYYESLLSGC